jgi:hypothetical protein
VKIKFWQILFLGVCIFSFQNEKEKIQRFNDPEIMNNAVRSIPYIINFQDTIPNDTLLEFVDKNNQPQYYTRNILTGVCINGECRLVNIDLFWTITGRYLGFEMPPGEFLSRTKHKPFVPEDYNRLHMLLADPLSPLAHYSLKELVPPVDSTKTNKVDAVSTATIAAVLDYIVKGAVYTTYTLWHIVYGQTKREIENLTAQQLTPELTMKLLESKNIDDQVWALNHIPGKVEIDSKLLHKIMDYISGDDVYLAERSLNALQSEILAKDSIQQQLANIYSHSGFLQQRLILEKLKDAPVLQPVLLHQLAEQLSQMNGILVKLMMDLFISKSVADELVTEEVGELLKNENRYIAKQALKYLENLNDVDKKTARNIEKYKKRNF